MSKRERFSRYSKHLFLVLGAIGFWVVIALLGSGIMHLLQYTFELGSG